MPLHKIRIIITFMKIHHYKYKFIMVNSKFIEFNAIASNLSEISLKTSSGGNSLSAHDSCRASEGARNQ